MLKIVYLSFKEHLMEPFTIFKFLSDYTELEKKYFAYWRAIFGMWILLFFNRDKKHYVILKKITFCQNNYDHEIAHILYNKY